MNENSFGGAPNGAGGPPPGAGGPQGGMGNPLGYAPVSSLMLKFAIPSIVGMLVSALYNMVDQLFIGKAVGTLGNTATSIAFPFTTGCMALALLLGIGSASCFNLSLGMGDKKRAPYFAGNALLLLVVSGVIMSVVTLAFLTPLLKRFGATDAVLPYAKEYVKYTAFGFPFLILTAGGGHIIRADGSPKMTMICNVTGAVINTILDAIFVLGFDWGMKGAAIATVIGQFISAAIVVIYCFNFKTVYLFGRHLFPKFSIIGRICSIGMASCFNQLAIAIVQIVLNNSLKHYGALSKYGADDPIAVAGIVMKVNMIVFSIVIGLAQGTQPIESFNYGAKNYDRVKSAFWMALKTGAAISLVAFVAFQLFPKQILSVFANKDASEGYYEFGAKFFRIFLFFTWINCLQPITATFFTSIGKSIKGVFLSLTRQILFFLPLLIVLPMFFKIEGITYTGPLADALSAIVAVIMAVYEFRDMHEKEWY
ncbi:MATE family efflux transporter [Ruminococcus flavefaciens]|uniref:MATE family efflux transporter n=1 Tax=Ruminococcus flavefaciens TaxID=1265 RepID=UPI0026EDC08E|nr:MATE family efflux transporter [Ruminococcus flavefaciens]MDD7516879.1 MATE family efflux transporter [Ruminococcus flavefaciens]MDY5690918.1 MATE family efflux transporter [Ruminococcus flavefaciens]